MTLHDHRLQAENDQLREQVADLKKALFEKADAVPTGLKLTGRMRQIFALLLKMEIVSKDQILAGIYAGKMWPDAGIVNVYISKMRHRLARDGIVINNRWGVGFWLDKTTKEKVAEMLRLERGEA